MQRIKYRVMKCAHVCVFKYYSSRAEVEVAQSLDRCIICRIEAGGVRTRQGKKLSLCVVCKAKRKKMLSKAAYARRKAASAEG